MKKLLVGLWLYAVECLVATCATAATVRNFTVEFDANGGTKTITCYKYNNITEYEYNYASTGVYSQNWIEDVLVNGLAFEDGIETIGYHSLIITGGVRYPGITRVITAVNGTALELRVKCARNTGAARSFTGQLNRWDTLTIKQAAGESPTTYTVTYKPGANGTGSQQTATKTKDVSLTLKGATFTRTGYTQTGWSTSDGGAKVYNLSASYTGNSALTLYPFWTANTYTVAFNANGGTGTMSNMSMTYDVVKTLTGNCFTKSGSEFAGWATSAGGNVVYANGASVENLTATQGATVTLYAKWTACIVGPWGDDPYIGDEETAQLPPTWIVNVSLSVYGEPAPSGSCVAGFDVAGVLRAFGTVENNGNLDICVSATEGTRLYWKVWIFGASVSEILDAAGTYVTQTPGFDYYDVCISVVDVVPQTISIHRAGWNLVSFNVLPDDPSPESVFADVSDNIQSVVSGTKRWTPQSGGRLAELKMGVGYWVKTTADNVEWTISGEPEEDVSVSVTQGWNLIGYPLLESGAPETVLRSAANAGIISSVVSGTKRWTPQSGGRLTELAPGIGYWLKADKAGTFRFDK